MTISRQLVQAITDDADTWFEPLYSAAYEWDILTDRRVKMWLAQCAHESAGFTRLVENLKYSANALRRTWPTRFTKIEAVEFAYDEYRIAERAYGGRMGNRKEGSGDGYRNRGRGIIMITGADNYRECGEALGFDLLNLPELLTHPPIAARGAGWFWYSRGCNELADANDYEGVTRAINGGTTGMDDRLAWLEKTEGVA